MREEYTHLRPLLLNAIEQAKQKGYLGKNILGIKGLNDVEYLSADAEDKFIIAQSNIHMNDYQEFADTEISSRLHSEFSIFSPAQIDYMDVSPQQVVGVSAALIQEFRQQKYAIIQHRMQFLTTKSKHKK